MKNLKKLPYLTASKCASQAGYESDCFKSIGSGESLSVIDTTLMNDSEEIE